MGAQEPSHSPTQQASMLSPSGIVPKTHSASLAGLFFNGFETTKVPFGLGCSGAWGPTRAQRGWRGCVLLGLDFPVAPGLPSCNLSPIPVAPTPQGQHASFWPRLLHRSLCLSPGSLQFVSHKICPWGAHPANSFLARGSLLEHRAQKGACACAWLLSAMTTEMSSLQDTGGCIIQKQTKKSQKMDL